MNPTHVFCLLATALGSAYAQAPASDDLWDVSQGTVVTASSDAIPGYSIESMLGGSISGDWTYFADGQPEGYVHFVEWETAVEVLVGQVRVFAFGDGPGLNHGREFDRVTIKAKSVGSSEYDVTLLDATPSHPYTLIDAGNALLYDQIIPAVISREFRAEFVQRTAGFGWDGPRIVELDAMPTPPPTPPVITSEPVEVTVNYGSRMVFEVTATGTGELHYQWFKNMFLPLPGETGSRLVIESVTEDANYMVRVSDDAGTIDWYAGYVTIDPFGIRSSRSDLWDVSNGVSITAHSDYHSAVYAPLGMFGSRAEGDGTGITYFADGLGAGTSHFVEWTTPAPVTVRTIRLFAFGDGPSLNNSREFESFTLRAKSPGSETFDILVGTYTPTRPYTILEWSDAALLDVEIEPIEASAFRAEFQQYTAGFGFDGPRIVELDAYATRPLVVPGIVVEPVSQAIEKNSSVTFHVVARGGSLSYQWMHNGSPIAGETSETLTITKVKASDSGTYSVLVSNQLGSASSGAASLTVIKSKNH